MKQFTFTLHDESVNTYGFRMLTDGANLDEFRKNPVMFLNHDDWRLPIGRWENIRVEGGRILADAVFDEADEEAVKVMRKVENDFLRMASIGTWPPEETSDAFDLKMPGQTGPTVTKWTMREASIVTIGANHNALAMYDRATGKRIDNESLDRILRLADTNIHQNTNNMVKTLKEILGLKDGDTDADVASTVEALLGDKARLEAENAELKEAAAKRSEEDRAARQVEAATLVDAAVLDGRINAEGKSGWIGLFDKDFDGTKAALAAIPKRPSVAAQIERSRGGAELADMAAKSWDELDREGRLIELRDKAPEVFRQKFKEHFGHEPSKY